MAETSLPSRAMTHGSDDEAMGGEDTSEVTKLFQERLQAFKHACGYLEDYIVATEKLQNSQSKEYEKVLKTVSHPLKEGNHFDQQLGGIAGMFDNIRGNTQGMANSHTETAKILKGQVLPIFERLHQEIKSKNKELTKGAGKTAKAVDRARATTQKHIEMLGSTTATFDSSGGHVAADRDPYLLQRGVMHRLNKQIIEENNNRNDLLAVQNSFAQFEAHIIQTFQTGLGNFLQTMNTQSEKTKGMYADMVGTAQRVPPDFEWQGFLKRNNNVLIDPNAPKRNVHNVTFPNMNHNSTQPLIAGSLDRKGKVFKMKWNTAYYVITPSKYLHEFDTDDDFAKDPMPENSLYLPDCTVGYLDGQKFTVKGKDVSKGKVPGMKGMMTHDFQFKAHTASDASRWYEVIRQAAGQVTNEVPASSEPNSPVGTVKKTGTGFSSLTASSGGSPTAGNGEASAGEKADLGQTTGTTNGGATNGAAKA
ncbi:hypothetical protein NA57DRAFT_40800 [Rhizodiscina lignyota]|uniref:PH domain-containing protein n=1 Tax=Rhizodiscina lignyota TaxID=1504668 RepID=A0A9P4IGX5_9PEZI|nr:hypothetical protein NA57DRAFT_40800 [Rhizodiscina lignyota]